MKTLVLLTGLTILSTCATAISTRIGLPDIKIYYAHQIPAEARRQMPRGSRTIFFGTSRLSPTTAPVAIHLYQLKTNSDEYTPDPNNPFCLSYCKLDVFMQYKTGHHSVLRRVNSIPLDSIRYGSADFSHSNDFKTVGMNWTWLDPKERRVPILRIDTAAVALYPYWGTHLLAVFPKGLQGKSIVQGFGHGSDNSSEGNSLESTFDSVDEKGLLTATTVHGSNNEAHNYKKMLHWNGEEFAVRAE